MNTNNQSTQNLKQIRLQVPITNLEPFTTSMKELVDMYPKEKKVEKKDEQRE